MRHINNADNTANSQQKKHGVAVYITARPSPTYAATTGAGGLTAAAKPMERRGFDFAPSPYLEFQSCSCLMLSASSFTLFLMSF